MAQLLQPLHPRAPQLRRRCRGGSVPTGHSVVVTVKVYTPGHHRLSKNHWAVEPAWLQRPRPLSSHQRLHGRSLGLHSAMWLSTHSLWPLLRLHHACRLENACLRVMELLCTGILSRSCTTTAQLCALIRCMRRSRILCELWENLSWDLLQLLLSLPQLLLSLSQLPLSPFCRAGPHTAETAQPSSHVRRQFLKVLMHMRKHAHCNRTHLPSVRLLRTQAPMLWYPLRVSNAACHLPNITLQPLFLLQNNSGASCQSRTSSVLKHPKLERCRPQSVLLRIVQRATAGTTAAVCHRHRSRRA
jgi:hypothetical protein